MTTTQDITNELDTALENVKNIVQAVADFVDANRGLLNIWTTPEIHVGQKYANLSWTNPSEQSAYNSVGIDFTVDGIEVYAHHDGDDYDEFEFNAEEFAATMNKLFGGSSA